MTTLNALSGFLAVSPAHATQGRGNASVTKSILECTNLKEIMSDLKPDDLTTKPGPSHASRFKDMLKTLLTSYPNSLSAIAGPIMQVTAVVRYEPRTAVQLYEYESSCCTRALQLSCTQQLYSGSCS
jgi:hypothetical protein